MAPVISIGSAVSETLISQVREMFVEYQQSLGIELSFQDFEKELSSLPDKYAPPQGRLYLAYVDGAVAGCIALRPYQGEHCEMKRLYVRPGYRRLGLGRLLAEKVIDDARTIGYSHMLLDTLSTMSTAQDLYSSLGFRQTQPYRYNPIEGTLYMKLDLRSVMEPDATGA